MALDVSLIFCDKIADDVLESTHKQERRRYDEMQSMWF